MMGKKMKTVISFINEIATNYKLIWELSKADFKKRFAGSYFGIVWMFVQPVVTVLIYFMVFQMGFKSVPPVPGVPYVLWLIPGIVPWFFFQEAMNAGTSSLSEYHYLVKKVVFHVEVLPVIKLVSCAMVHGIFAAIMIAVFFCYGHLPMLTWFQILYYSFALAVNILALTLFTASVHVFFKDMAQLVAICLQFGIWMLPIMWAPEMFPDFPPVLSQILKINPIYYIVVGYRDSMLSGNLFFERPMLTVYFWSVTLLLLTGGLFVFRKLRPHFSDVL